MVEPDHHQAPTAASTEIHAALLSYCRGIDRLDPAALLAAFHPGAELRDYGSEPMSIEAFADYALSSLEQRFSATQHRISNTTIEMMGDGGSNRDQALVETYVMAGHLQPGPATNEAEPDRLHTFNGRYIDWFERRNGQWLIAVRTLRIDWSRVETVDETMGGSWVASGRGGSPDPLYD